MTRSLSPYTTFRTICRLRLHEPSSSAQDVLLNLDHFPQLRVGQFVQILPLKANAEDDELDGPDDGEEPSLEADATSTFPEPQQIITDESRAFNILVRDSSQDIKAKDPKLKISLSTVVAQAFGIAQNNAVLVQVVDQERCVASHVELTFRDEYLSRGDMWRLATSELSERTVYKGQRIVFLNTIKATVKHVWINGSSKTSGHFASDTKPIFRSESARYTLFIQMSREMWEFDTESSGDINFNKVIHGFLPELFKKWMSINAHHLVSIILFARLNYEDDTEYGRERSSGLPQYYQDFYRVVVSDMASNDWVNILDQLKKEFHRFLQETRVRTEPSKDGGRHVIIGELSPASSGNILEALNLASSQFSRDYVDRDLVRTGISVVVITAGAGHYEVSYDMLKLTTELLMGSGIGIDLVCLSPMPLHSVPLFAYRNPRVLDAKESAVGPISDPSVADQIPRRRASHTRKAIPEVFSDDEFEPKAGDWSYAIPHWIDVSYWKGAADENAFHPGSSKARGSKRDQDQPDVASYQPRVRLYDLQMGGLMEDEMTSLALSKLHDYALHPWHRIRHQISGKAPSKESERRIGEFERAWMDDYDDYVFRPPNVKVLLEEAARKRAEKDGSDTSRFSTPNGELDHEKDLFRQSGGSLRPGSGFLDWNMHQSHKEPAPKAINRKPSNVSLLSTATADTAVSSPRIARRSFLRHISFGVSQYKSSQPTVSADLSAAGVTRPAASNRDQRASPSLAHGTLTALKYTQQLRAALTRPESRGATDSGTALTSVAKEAKEHSRPIKIGALASVKVKPSHETHSRHPSDEFTPGSVETTKESVRGTPKSGLAREIEEKLGGLHHLRKNIQYLSSSAEKEKSRQTLTLSRALSPWLNLLNPCNSRHDDFQVRSQFTRWQHVFPRPTRADKVKWKSLCYPASVPLTNDYFPTSDQLQNEYSENFYNINQDTDLDVNEAREHLIRELIAFRLAHGFQITVGDSVSEFLGSKQNELARVFDSSYMAQEGATIFMSMGSTIHQLLCGADGKVEIRRFTRKPTQQFESSTDSNAVNYKPKVKTVLAKEYEQRQITFKSVANDYNWNITDNFIAGYTDDFTDALRFWRARFVLIPVNIPVRRGLSTVREDTDEEIRLEGIRRITQVWQRHRILTEEERAVWSLKRQKDPNPLAIEYRTRDPSAVVAAGDNLLLSYGDQETLAPAEMHTTRSFDLKKLAEDLQAEGGVKMMDRKWHWRFHYNCFIGSDMTSWLLLNFKDIDDREGAVTFGNRLMNEGLFVHVKGEKDFRDGQYFYRLKDDYGVPRLEPRMGWFGATRSLRSMPATPTPDQLRCENVSDKASTNADGVGNLSAGNGRDSSRTGTEKKTVFLSKMMKYDVDPRHRSYRPETINLHYDTLHNPDNCFHVRVEWMNATAKLIEDAVVSWGMEVKRFGLNLVELPISEASAISAEHPFRSPYLVQLSKQPPSTPTSLQSDAASFAADKRSDQFVYHKALLKKLNFVLDYESVDSFPMDVDVQYSWGPPDYTLTQYIHRSGLVLAQISTDGQILLLANRLCSDRAGGRREVMRPNPIDRDTSASHRNSRRSPITSPSMKPIHEGTRVADTGAGLVDEAVSRMLKAEDIKDEVERFCNNPAALEAFYKQVDLTNTDSPLVPAMTSDMGMVQRADI